MSAIFSLIEGRIYRLMLWGDEAAEQGSYAMLKLWGDEDGWLLLWGDEAP